VWAHTSYGISPARSVEEAYNTMRMEIVYFDRCPTYLAAVKTLREVLEQHGIAAEVELVVVNTDGETQELHFAGSPAIRVDSEDLFPVAQRAEYALGCRMYATTEGFEEVAHGRYAFGSAGEEAGRKCQRNLLGTVSF
jgi:hypothetical protein